MTCLGCDASFVPEHVLQQYCTVRCRSVFHEANRMEREWTDRGGRIAPCKQCAVPFDRSTGYEGGKAARKFCSRACQRLWHEHNRTAATYSITVEDYDVLFAAQSGVCAVCNQPETALTLRGVPFRLAIDHDHETGAVRGLLCADCNRALGLLRESVDVLLSAIRYLEKSHD